jgi:hypothetical protein
MKKGRKRPSYPQIFSPFLAASTKRERESTIFNNLPKEEDRKEGRKDTP